MEEEEELPRITSRDRRQPNKVVRFADGSSTTKKQAATTPYEGRRLSESKISVPSRTGQDNVAHGQQETPGQGDDSCVDPEPVEDTHPCADDTQTSQEVPQTGNETASEDIDLRRSSRLKKPRMLYDPTSGTYKPVQ